MKYFSNIALNRILTLPDYFLGLEILISSGIIDIQNNFVILVRKQHTYRISVPMLYIAFLYCTSIVFLVEAIPSPELRPHSSLGPTNHIFRRFFVFRSTQGGPGVTGETVLRTITTE